MQHQIEMASVNLLKRVFFGDFFRYSSGHLLHSALWVIVVYFEMELSLSVAKISQRYKPKGWY
jgi:hypothetical protein